MQSTRKLPLQQHPYFKAAVSKLGTKTRTIELAGSEPVQTIVRFGLRFASRGPIWHGAPAAVEASALRRSGLHLINSDGGDQTVFENAGYLRIASPIQVAELSIVGTPEDRLRRMKGKWRNGLRRGLKNSQIIQREEFRHERHRWLLEADMRQQRAKGFRNLPHSFLRAYASANPGKSIVFVAYSSGEPIAGMLFLVHGTVATYHLGWTSHEGRSNASHHTILKRAGDYFSRRLVERIDLGTIDLANANGLARFKIGTGAVTRPLGGTWLRVPWL